MLKKKNFFYAGFAVLKAAENLYKIINNMKE